MKFSYFFLLSGFLKKKFALLLTLSFHILFGQEGEYNILNTSVNSNYAEFGVTYSGNNSVIFASSKNNENGRRSNNSQLSLELYRGMISKNGDIIQTGKFSNEINNKFFESDISFSPDFKTIYFTMNNFYSSLKFNDTEKWKTLQMFRASFNNNFEISNEQPLPFNNAAYSVRSPAVSKDGSKLYFVSDMPGGFGGMDVYVAEIKNDGSYGVAKNLGSAVNTKQSELFPYLDKENTLYFSSNGHKGMGGLDIFKSEFKNGIFEQAHNLSAPFNSKFDDFAYVFDNATNSGYFTSNRDGGKGDVDIYAFSEKGSACKQTIYGNAFDAITEESLEQVTVSLFQNNQFIEKQLISKNGGFKFKVTCGETYKLVAEKLNYENSELSISIDDKNKSETRTSMKLTPIECAQLLSGTVTDGETNLPLPNATVYIHRGKEALAKINLADDATFKFKLECDMPYKLTVSLNTYHDLVSYIKTTDKINEALSMNLQMESSLEFVEVRSQKMIKIKTINFDLDQSSIRLDAAIELNKVIAVMKKYPNLKIEIKSHTDSRASSNYNMKITNDRAKKVIDYIIANGIDNSRVSGRGYGETQLLNNCAKGVKCSEAEHQLNRRTEFIISDE